MGEHGHHTERRAGHELGGPEQQPAEIQRVQRVGVLRGVDRLGDHLGRDLIGQRELDQDAGAVAGLRLRTTGATMVEVHEDLLSRI